MKKLLFILSFLFFVLIGKSQITTPTKISSGGIQPARYSDTTAANNVNGVKNIAGNLIITSDNILWQRNSTATGWIAAGGSSSTNIYNIYNTSITNVSIINQSDTTVTYEICTGAGACDTLVAVTNVTYKIGAQVSFIDSAHIQICGIDSATQVSSCDTFSIPAQKLYVFQNGTQEPSAGVVEGGGNLSHTLTYNMNSNVASFLNGTFQYQDAGATYAGGNVLTSDINGNASWQPIPGQGASGGTYIISGLNVVWDSLLTFDVTAGTYMINGVLYHSNFTVVTLDTLIGTDPRRDEIIADTLGVVSKITGTPSSDPAAPTPNPLSQIGITDVLINAGDNVPANVTQGFIYNEGTGTAGGEWDTASSISAARFRNTAHPYNGTYDLYVPSFTNNATITFTNNTTVDLSAFTSVSYAIRLNSAFANATYLTLRWYNGNTAVSNAINVRTGNYGWVRTTINNYQHVAVPMSAFTFSSYTANKLVITLVSHNSSGFYFDYLQLQSNVGQPPAGNGLIGLQVANFSPLFNSTTTITNNLANVTYSAQNATAYRVFGNFTNTSAAPTFGQIDLGTSVVTGLLPVTNLAVAPANYYLGSLDGATNQWLPLSNLFDTAYTIAPIRTLHGAIRDTIYLNYGNGLQLVNDSLYLGGTLVQNTTINSGGFPLTYTGSTGTIFSVYNTDASGSGASAIYANALFANTAISGMAVTGYGVIGTTSSYGTGVQGISSTGIGVSGQSTDGLGGTFRIIPSNTNAVQSVIQIQRGSSGTPSNGIGGSLDFLTADVTVAYQFSNQLISKWTDATDATRTSQFIITGVDSASTVNLLTLDGTGYMQMKTMTAAVASTITPADGMIVYVSTTDGTFTAVGFWGYVNGAWAKLN